MATTGFREYARERITRLHSLCHVLMHTPLVQHEVDGQIVNLDKLERSVYRHREFSKDKTCAELLWELEYMINTCKMLLRHGRRRHEHESITPPMEGLPTTTLGVAVIPYDI